MPLESFRSSEEELVFLFGQHAVDLAIKRGPEYYVRRMNPKEFRDAARGMRIRIGPERVRFARNLGSDTIGAMIHAMLDTEAWDKLVIAHAAESVPSEEGSKAKKTRTVQKRRFSTSRLDPRRDG
jgi:hypothetical protein